MIWRRPRAVPDPEPAKHTQCPVCFYNVAVREGRIVDHPSKRIAYPGQTARSCAGSGQSVEE